MTLSGPINDQLNNQSAPSNISFKLGLIFLRKRLYLGIALAIFIIAIDTLANKMSWYWIFKWLDIPMHILGGILAGYFGLWLYSLAIWYKSKYKISIVDLVNKSKRIWPAIISAIIVGIVWEVIEYYFGLSGLNEIHRTDTLFDLVNDTFGGFLAFLVWKYLSRNIK